MLVRIEKKWDFPDLLRQTPGGLGVWGDLHFTLEPVEKCDYLIVLNQLHEDIQVECPPQNVWALFQEPYEPDFLSWMRDGHGQFARVYTHRPPSRHARYRGSHPMVPWHVGRNYDQLMKDVLHVKLDRVSWVTSSLQILPGHKLRYSFLEYLQDQNWELLDLFGKEICPVEDKWTVLAPYHYSIAVENSSGPDYWTEKVADCWLAGTLPFYYGCTNLEKYFPADSFIRIDINQPEAAYRSIRQALETNEYQKRVGSIEKARQLVLNQQQFFPKISREIMANGNSRGAHRLLQLRKFRVGTFRQVLRRFAASNSRWSPFTWPASPPR